MADITMPQLGETVTEGTIIRWLKAVGDPVAQDEALFEVSTDKVDSEVPSPVSGTLVEILVKEGETVDVGARLAVVGDAGAAPAPAAEAPAAEVPGEALEQSAPAVAAPTAGVAESVPPAPQAAPAPAPAAAAPFEEAPAPAPAPAAAPPPPPSAPATPPATPPPVPATVGATAPPAASSEGGNGTRGALLSPVVRRLVRENNLEANAIPGTGLGGRITRDDVLRYLDTRPAAQAPTAAPAAPATSPVPSHASPVPAAASAPATERAALAYPPAPPGARDEVVPFSTIRRVTAEHMVRSKATSAHTLVAVEVDFERVEKVRAKHKAAFKDAEGVNLTYLPFVARAVVDVLRDYPHLNSSVGDDALVIHKDVHLGFAVDLAKEGLIVPVVHNADGQSLRGLARSVADLAERARSRRLSADDIAGGTFTITNPGPFGTYMTFPIIAQPQVAILSTDGVKRRPVVVTGPDGSEGIAIHSVGVLSLSFDHRAVDGAYAAAFMRDLGRTLETRDWEAEL